LIALVGSLATFGFEELVLGRVGGHSHGEPEKNSMQLEVCSECCAAAAAAAP
jgi:hypothetical protein